MDIDQNYINVNLQDCAFVNKNQPITPGYVLEIKTLQISAFKILIESLKESLKDATLKFTPVYYEKNGEINSASGISIVAMNQSTSVLIRLKLPAKNFEVFYVKSKKPVLIGVNMTCLHKLIKSIGNDDQMLTLFLEENDLNHLGIKIENLEKNTSTTYKLIVLDAENENMNIQNSEFEAVVTMQSSDFQKIIRDMSNICDTVNIAFVDGANNRNTLIFQGQGEFASQKTVLQAKESDTDNANSKEVIIQGTYDLRNLSLFLKCSNLCPNIDLYMKNNFPLIIKYQIANLGHVYLVLSHKAIEDNEDTDEEDRSDNNEELEY
jgi:proliferating cell nuclear antigen